MHFRTPFSLFLLAALAFGTVALVGCDSAGPGSTDDPEMGSLGEVNVQMTTASAGGSARAAAAGTEAGNAAPGAAEIEEASVTIAGVELVGEDRSYTLSGEEQEIDLLALEDGVPADLALEEEVPPGEYDQLRFDVTDTRLLLSDGADPTLKVPSGKIKLLLPDFEIEEEGDEADITVEFDVEKSFVKAGKSGKYIFKPTVRARSVEVNGEDRNENVETAGQVTAYTEGESVAVEGIEFAITGDTEIDEELALEEGQGVEIEGARSETGAEYVAKEIEAREENEEEGAVLEAPLEEVRPGESSIVLVGTPFAIDADTKFEGFNVLSDLEGGSRAEVVFAYDAASGTYRALEIESESSGEGEDDKGEEGDDDENEDNEEAAEVKGRVTSAPADGSVAVEGLGFAVTGGTEAGDGGLEAITEGDFVELEATYTSGGTLVATEIEVSGDAAENAALETAVESVADGELTLLGTSFAVDSETELNGFDALEALEQGDAVEVTFSYDAEADAYRALKIEADGSGDD